MDPASREVKQYAPASFRKAGLTDSTEPDKLSAFTQLMVVELGTCRTTA
jgi:hypothetical protein